jgi:hypothetical protein
MTVEFNVSRIDLLERSLQELRLQYIKSEVANLIRLENGIEIDLDNKQVVATRYEMGTVNEIKRTYAEVALAEVAKKKRWAMKKTSNRTFELRRY